jgi:predicted  nucleic acid-binding Zn-ribbon protein
MLNLKEIFAKLQLNTLMADLKYNKNSTKEVTLNNTKVDHKLINTLLVQYYTKTILTTIKNELSEKYLKLREQEPFKIFKSNNQSLISELQTQVLLFNQTIIPHLELNLNTLREHRETNETEQHATIINELIDKNKQSTEASVQEIRQLNHKCLQLQEVQVNYQKLRQELEEYKRSSDIKYVHDTNYLKEQLKITVEDKEAQRALTEKELNNTQRLMQELHEKERRVWDLDKQLVGQKDEFDSLLSIERLRITNLKKEITELKVQRETLNTTLNEQKAILTKTRVHRDEYKRLVELSYPDNQSNPNKLFQTASKPLHAIITLLDNFHDTLLSKIQYITKITEEIHRVQNFNLERRIKTVKLSLELSTNQEDIEKIDLLYSIMMKDQQIQHDLPEYTKLTIERDRLKERISQIFKDLKAIKDIDFGAHKEEEHLMLRQKQLQEEITAFSTDFEVNFTKLKNDYAKYEALLFNHTEATKEQVLTSRLLLEASRKPIPGKNSSDNLLKKALEPPRQNKTAEMLKEKADVDNLASLENFLAKTLSQPMPNSVETTKPKPSEQYSVQTKKSIRTEAVEKLAALQSSMKKPSQPMPNSVEGTKLKPLEQLSIQSTKLMTPTKQVTPVAISVTSTFTTRPRGLTTQITNDLPSVLSKSTELSPPKTVSDSEVD